MIDNAYTDFRRGMGDLPDGQFAAARGVCTMVNYLMDSIIDEISTVGFKALGNDRAYELESALYRYIKESNPGIRNELTIIEGRGSR